MSANMRYTYLRRLTMKLHILAPDESCLEGFGGCDGFVFGPWQQAGLNGLSSVPEYPRDLRAGYSGRVRRTFHQLSEGVPSRVVKQFTAVRDNVV